MALRIGLIATWLAMALVSGCGNRGGDGNGMGIFTDAGSRMDGEAPEQDTGPGGDRDTGPIGDRDTGPSTGDAGTPPPGQCAPDCLTSFPGAFCCTTCGCAGTSGACIPVCPADSVWDCELSCCHLGAGMCAE